jgi:hypothetical protein
MRTGPTERASRAHDAQPRLPNLLRNCRSDCERLPAATLKTGGSGWTRLTLP